MPAAKVNPEYETKKVSRTMVRVNMIPPQFSPKLASNAAEDVLVAACFQEGRVALKRKGEVRTAMGF